MTAAVFALAVPIASLTTGCSEEAPPAPPAQSQPAPVTTKPQEPLSEEARRAIRVANEAIAARETWSAEQATYEVRAIEEGWSVMVWRIEGYSEEGEPRFVPGGYRIVMVDAEGNVVDYHRGK